MGEHAHQPCAPLLGQRTERAVELATRLAALRLGLGGDEVGKAFDLRQIELAGIEGAARELARLRQPQARQRAERRDQRGQHGAAAMHVQLADILAGEAAGCRKPQREAVVDDGAPSGSRKRARAATRGGGTFPVSAVNARPASGPEMRMMATPDFPAAVAGAKIVARVTAPPTRPRAGARGRTRTRRSRR